MSKDMNKDESIDITRPQNELPAIIDLLEPYEPEDRARIINALRLWFDLTSMNDL